MKRNVWVFGLISGTLISLFMVSTMAMVYNSGQMGGSMLVGFAAMILALSFIFVAVKNYRDKYNSGVISFGKAFQIGLLISLIASTMYTLSWAIEYHMFLPNWMDKFSEHAIRTLENSGAGAAAISAKTLEIQKMREAYQNPVMFVLYTFIEIFPVGLIVSLIAATLLMKKRKSENLATV